MTDIPDDTDAPEPETWSDGQQHTPGPGCFCDPEWVRGILVHNSEDPAKRLVTRGDRG